MRTDESIAQEIRETVWMIMRDIEPILRNDPLNYSGYIYKNIADLQKLLKHFVN